MTEAPESCLTCRYCRTSSTPPRCRRRPPTVLPTGSSMWPAVTKTDWCGDWTVKEAEA